MKDIKKIAENEEDMANTTKNHHHINKIIIHSWNKIAPSWPLKNLIAVNPISGFEDLPFEEALKQSQAYFQQKNIPEYMQDVNRESIKWLQAFFDKGQSTIQMPNRHLGFLESILSMIKFDNRVHKNDKKKIQWLINLNNVPENIIAETMINLDISNKYQEQFLTLMLTTLPGWASYIQYYTSWADSEDTKTPYTITKSEYLAFRLILTYLLFPSAKELITWHQEALKHANVKELHGDIIKKEKNYQENLINSLENIDNTKETSRYDAQLVFCIDVRSEPFRRALEKQGNYDTYGFAGFFGLPVAIENAVTGDSYCSCPVLLKPAHTIVEHPSCLDKSCKEGYNRIQGIKKLYQSVKYTFTTPFSLVEAMGLGNGIWMGLKSFFPNIAKKIQSGIINTIAPQYALNPDIKSINIEQQTNYGANALKMMGLTKNFAPLVFFCGHGSTTQNNAYASSLDCGACGGRNGSPNARILASILNNNDVRKNLKQRGINIPQDTTFIAAEHNTTTDEVNIYDNELLKDKSKQLERIKNDLQKARNKNSLWRANKMDLNSNINNAYKKTSLRSKDWAQVRPEWGLAKNAAFIIAPRVFTKEVNLDGRSFLHSYEWEQDKDRNALTTILTAPMIVAQWINAQYLFSTIDNVAFGGGSKITKNITGKIGIMQGNASDLMHGLPLQSVYKSDKEAYHSPMRLTVVVYAPKSHIDPIIEQQPILQKLFGNGWVHLICHDPNESQKFKLDRKLQWCKI